MRAANHRIQFGARLRELRKAAGWSSQEDFAHHAGLDRTYVSGIERGVRNPTLDVMMRLAVALDVAPAELMVGVDAGDVVEAADEARQQGE